MDRRTSHVVPTSLHEALEREAAANDRSLSAEIRVRLRATASSASDASTGPVGDRPSEAQEAS